MTACTYCHAERGVNPYTADGSHLTPCPHCFQAECSSCSVVRDSRLFGNCPRCEFLYCQVCFPDGKRCCRVCE